MQFGRIAQPVEYDARLNRGQLGSGINGTQRIHVAGKIEDHGDIGALARRDSCPRRAEAPLLPRPGTPQERPLHRRRREAG